MKNIIKRKVIGILALSATACCSAVFFGARKTVEANAAEISDGVFEMVEGASLKISDEGGIRFRVKFDETTKAEIDKENTKLYFLITGKSVFDKVTDGNYKAMSPAINGEADEAKIYKDGDYYYANGVVKGILEANRAADYMCIAYVSDGTNVQYATVAGKAVGEDGFYLNNVRGDLYDLVNSAVLDHEGGYAKSVLASKAYTWYNSVEYPILVDTLEDYNALVSAVNEDVIASAPYVKIADVDVSADGAAALADGKSLNVYRTVSGKVAQATPDEDPDRSPTDTEVVARNGNAELNLGKIVAADGTYATQLPAGEWTLTFTHPMFIAEEVKINVTDVAANDNDVTLYRKIIDIQDGSFTVANERAANDRQTISTSNRGYTYASFNIAPGSVYYAEVTFKSTSTNNVWIGLSNMIKGNADKFAVSAMTLNDTNCNSGEFYMSGNNSWNITTAKAGYPLFQSWQLKGYRNFSIDTAGEITYATARDGDYIYYFVNGVYVNGYTLKDYRENDTIPGIFGHNLQPVTMSKIDYYSGDKARNKIDALLAGGKNIISQYLSYTENLSNDANSYGENENRFFKVNDVTSERGVNFDFTNKSVSDSVKSRVTPYIHFDGDFSFEFDYKATDFNDDGNQHRMYVRVRNWYGYGNDRKDLLWFGTQVTSGSNVGGVLCKDKAYRADVADWTRFFTSGSENFDAKNGKGLRFKITRRLYENRAEYTLTVTSLDDTSKTATKILNVTASEDSQWDKPVQIYWENQNIAGQYSNIRWQAE